MKEETRIPKEETRILIADDHALIRKGLRQVVEAEANFEVVGEATNGKEALALIIQHQPRIVILDVNMPEMVVLRSPRRWAGAN
jgi:YesN/AraC family two-component response regulator